MFDVMRFWLERGVDGFRLDVAHFIMKDPELTDQPGRRTRRRGGFKDMADYGTQDHLYDKGHPDVHAVFRRLRALLDGYEPPRVVDRRDPHRGSRRVGAVLRHRSSTNSTCRSTSGCSTPIGMPMTIGEAGR